MVLMLIGEENMKLRQIALVASNLAETRGQFFQLLGLEDDFLDEGVGFFGLDNSVMPIGQTFLEIVSPNRDDTTAGRLLTRRSGDGGYMVLVQVGEIAPVSLRVDRLGIRKVWETDREEVTAFHVHPKDIGAAIVSFDEMRPPEEWVWAGPGWRNRRASHVEAISGVTIQCKDPESVARRWSEVFAKLVEWEGERFVMCLDEGLVDFVEAADGRGDGLSAVLFDTEDIGTIKAEAEAMSLEWIDDEVELCGTRLQFREV